MRGSLPITTVLLTLALTACGGNVSSIGPASSIRDGSLSGMDSAGAESAFDAGPDGDAASDSSCMVQASDFDQTCSVDSDCKSVLSGFVCFDPCTTFGVINSRELSTYEQTVNLTIQSSVSAVSGGIQCLLPRAYCDAGLCAMSSQEVASIPPPVLDASPGDLHVTVLCVEDAGVMDAGAAIPGASRWCNGPESCLPFNGGWQCCSNVGAIEMCVPP